MLKFRSDISGKEFPITEKVAAMLVRKPIIDLIKKDHPGFDDQGHLAMSELNHYREKYISGFLVEEMGELSQMEAKVVKALRERTLVSDKLDESPSTFGQRVADKVASFGGSWTFIISFVCFLLLWIGANVFYLANKGFDPYPFILLIMITGA